MKCPYDNSDLVLELELKEVDGEEMIEVALWCNECSYESWTYLKPRIVDSNWALVGRYD